MADVAERDGLGWMSLRRTAVVFVATVGSLVFSRLFLPDLPWSQVLENTLAFFVGGTVVSVGRGWWRVRKSLRGQRGSGVRSGPPDG